MISTSRTARVGSAAIVFVGAVFCRLFVEYSRRAVAGPPRPSTGELAERVAAVRESRRPADRPRFADIPTQVGDPDRRDQPDGRSLVRRDRDSEGGVSRDGPATLPPPAAAATRPTDRYVWGVPLGVGRPQFLEISRDTVPPPVLRENYIEAANRLSAINRPLQNPFHGKVFSVVAFRTDTDTEIILGGDQGDFVQTPEQVARMLRQADGIPGPVPSDVVDAIRVRVVRHRIDREREKARAWTALARVVPPAAGEVGSSAFLLTEGRLVMFDASTDPELGRRMTAWDSAHRALIAALSNLFDNAR